MNRWSPTLSLLILAPCLLLAPACTTSTSDDNDPVYVPDNTNVVTRGTFIVDWSINGVKDPSQCVQSSSDQIDITVNTSAGVLVGRFQQRCDTFATTIALDPGTYTASALLIDAQSTQRTTAAQMGTFTIRRGEEITAPIDFPAASFF